MKNLFKIGILAVTLFICSVTAKAQSNTGYFASATNASGLDTVTNTATKTQTLALAGGWDVVTIQVAITKISGTVGGTLTLKGSVDGIAYTTIGSAVTPTDTTAAYSFSVNPSTYAKYQISYTGATTQAASIKTAWLSRHLNPQQRQF